MFPDDAAVVTHAELQRLLNLFAKAFDEFSLTISLQNTGDGRTCRTTHNTINNCEL
ncbi:hypothetical protein DPMN_177378 [Dreissena polymorpha]|uniref:Uncharacterized protein n=1 Tax=Dreissena polymorpha TaxID=45954 RepID=A0A9D4ED63_DREPO|nr:hypothetical protein DPMN_177378 [Dreissena polymorpha]